MTEITVTLTREQWERVARILRYEVGRYPVPIAVLEAAKINRAICEQAGLGEEFRCE